MEHPSTNSLFFLPAYKVVGLPSDDLLVAAPALEYSSWSAGFEFAKKGKDKQINDH